MSASGQKAKSRADQRTSALASKPDISRLRVHALKKPGSPRLFLFSLPWRASGSRAHSHHEGIESEFGHLHPRQGVTAISYQAAVHLAEMWIGLGKVGIDFVGGVIA